MIAFDYSNSTETACQAPSQRLSGYAATTTSSRKNDSGSELTVRGGNPGVQQAAAVSDQLSGSDSLSDLRPIR